MQRVICSGTIFAIATALILLSGCARDPWWTDPDVTWITTYGDEGSDVGADALPALFFLLCVHVSFFFVSYTQSPAVSFCCY